ncbi:MAG: D-alanine--D-alanine ligase [Phycisphaeraceae bacterium]|nr:D-alanine--D-alanine ligase [Phycisphaeraceae bacterium]
MTTTPPPIPNPPASLPPILVLGGGPDAEREVSLRSSKAVAEALAQRGHTVHNNVINRLTGPELATLPGGVVFPVLHGGWGEGGPLQDLLEADGRPFVGCGAASARLAMDKFATKLIAAALGVPTAPAAMVNPADRGLPLSAPAVFKPVHEGSSVGLHVCRDDVALAAAHEAVLADIAANPGRVYMIERAILGGRELTVGVLDGHALPIVEIIPAGGVYDYTAKYASPDTRYTVAPHLPEGLGEAITAHALSLARAIGVRHLCRIDFILGADGVPWLLEVNTMPGFTGQSLLPKAAAHAGIGFGELCERLAAMAVRDGPGPARAASPTMCSGSAC